MHEITEVGRRRRVRIFQRDDGKWSWVEEHFSDHPFEMCWIPQSYGVSICDSRETALSEASSRVDWLVANQS